MIVNGHVKPFSYNVEVNGRPQTRWQMAYQEPGDRPVGLCGVQVPDGTPKKPPPEVCDKHDHGSALSARRCATAMEWGKRLYLHGYTVLTQLREIRAAADAEAKAAAEAELAAAR